MGKKFLFSLATLLITIFLSILLLEIGLRLTIVNKPLQFQLSKRLKFYNPFIVDNHNVFRHNLEQHISLREAKQQIAKNKYSFINKINNSKDIFTRYLYINYLSQSKSISIDDIERHLEHNDFKPIASDLINAIKKNKDSTFEHKLAKEYSDSSESELNRDIRKFNYRPINRSGFRSIAFKNHQTDRKKLLLLGDSFTYGFSAMPFHKSFANKLLAEGYLVYNCGIPGANVINYYDAAKVYLSKIKPDYVFLFFYVKNDVITSNFDSTHSGYKPFHATSLGWLNTTIGGEYTPNFKDYRKKLLDCVYKGHISFIEGNSLLFAMLKNQISKSSLNDCFVFPDDNLTATNAYLRKIKRLSNEINAKFRLIVIPDQYNLKQSSYSKELNKIFRGIEEYSPRNLSKKDYRFKINDPHFNNAGHMKMKRYVETIITSKAQKNH